MKIIRIIAILVVASFIISFIALSQYGLFAPGTIPEKIAGSYIITQRREPADEPVYTDFLKTMNVCAIV